MNDETLFNLALERPFAERADFLKEACGDDQDRRQRVEALVHAHEHPEGFLGTPCLTPPPLPTDGLHAPAMIDLDFLQPSSRPDALGRLDHYEILEVVGSGGFGVVLKAFDEKLHRVVAIKALAPALAASATSRKRFVREARAAAAVSHESIVHIHAVEESGSVPYLVMGFVAGTSLEERIKKNGTLEPKEILRIGLQAAQGLAAAHRHGLVHRDVKPANILLENGVQRVKITDFGLARTVDDASVTQTGVIAGTPSYMSPEQARGEMADHRSDLFSLGCVLYAMCTGRSPFRAETTIAAIRRVCDDDPRPIVEINPEIPPAIVMIIDRLLSKNPDDRFQSAEEAANLLQHQLAADGQACSLSLKSPISQRSASRARRWPIAAAAIVLIGFTLTVTDATGVTRVGELMRTILRVQTPAGTLVIEVDDPEVRVTIEGDGGLVITGAGPQQVSLRPGSYRVQANKNGLPVPIERELVTIRRGDKQVLRVRIADAVSTSRIVAPNEDDWVRLFSGKDLSGWKAHPKQPGNWRVEDGQLVGDAPMDSHLFSTRGDYRDFHLRAEIKINQMGKGGVFFRSEYGLGNVGKFPVGLQASIYNGPQQTGSRERETETTGSLYWRSGYAGILVPNEDWFTLEIIAHGRNITIKVNGVTTTGVALNPADEPNGHIALMQREGTVLRFRKIEVKELTARATPTTARAFVVLSGKQLEERRFDTLAEAVVGTGDGDTIEIRGDGPFASPPVFISKSITLRAGNGFRPTIQMAPLQSGHLLTSEAALTLEGIELRNPIKQQHAGGYSTALWAHNGPLRAANCRFVIENETPAPSACVNCYDTAQAAFRNCEFLRVGNAGGCGISYSPPSSGDLLLENCVDAGWYDFLVVHFNVNEVKDVGVRVRQCTSAAQVGLYFMPVGLPLLAPVASPEQPPVLSIECANSLFHFRKHTVVFGGRDQTRAALPPESLRDLFRRYCAWREAENLYSLPPHVGVVSTAIAPSQGAVTVADGQTEWSRFWNLDATGSLIGEPKFQRGDVYALARTIGERVQTEDFRLIPDSPGYRAGKDGKDLGADIDLVGPGAAFERWKRTPEHQEWLQESEQMK